MTQLQPHQTKQVQQIGDTICRKGWRIPALLLLESGRPFHLLGEQLVWLAQPMLSLFWPYQAVGRFADLLAEPAAFDALMQHLEAHPADE